MTNQLIFYSTLTNKPSLYNHTHLQFTQANHPKIVKECVCFNTQPDKRPAYNMLYKSIGGKCFIRNYEQ